MSTVKRVRDVLPVVALFLGAAPAIAGSVMLTGQLSGDSFGGSVARVGDVNGDGISDFLIGAPGALGTAGKAGTVSLYLGNTDSVFTSPDLVFEGEVAGDAFGFAVAGAGDVDDDGFDDILVGAPRNDGIALDAGRVYLFRGGTTISLSPSRFWDGDLAGGHFGASLAGHFDFDHDGYGDFAAGAPESNLGATRAGQVKIYLGASSVNAILQPASFRFTGDQANWALGWSLDAAGDLDGDQYGDLIAGAPQPFDVNSGRAVIWFGQNSTSVAPSRLVLSGEVGSDRFGFSVSGAGDRNQDGYDDAIVGAPGHDSQGFDKGAAYVFLGGFNVNAIHDWKTVGETAGDSLGYAVDGAEDGDGDAIPEIAIGAPGADNPAGDSGEVRLYLGSSYPSTAADTVIAPVVPDPGFESDDRFGAALALVGPVSGGTASQLLAGAPYGNDDSGTITGYVDLLPIGTGAPVPVRLLSFIAARSGERAEFTWELEDAGLLTGVRIDVEQNASWNTVSPGWIDPMANRFVDTTPPPGEARYRMLGLTRSGEVTVLGVTSLSGRELVPMALRLLENPYRQSLGVRATLPFGSSRIVVLDASGREVRRLWEGRSPGETVSIAWDGRDARGREVVPGLYILHLQGEHASVATKVVKLAR